MDARNWAFNHSHEQGDGEGQFSGASEDSQHTKFYRTEEFESNDMGRMPGARSFQGAHNNEINNSTIITVGGNFTQIQHANLEFESALAIERDTSKICSNQALQSLPIAFSAAHTANLRVGGGIFRKACSKGVRIDVLDDIRHWLWKDDGAPVFWLAGADGITKTTIAMTICEEIEELNTGKKVADSENPVRPPLVSFFASRQLDSGKGNRLIPSICRRLSDHSSSYGTKLAKCLERDSTLAAARHDIQFEKMLVEPWTDSSSERSRKLPIPIVVVDALDENENGFHFLEKLLRAIEGKKLGGLRFLVTSCTEPRIAKLCQSFEPDAVCRLQGVPQRCTLWYLRPKGGPEETKGTDLERTTLYLRPKGGPKETKGTDLERTTLYLRPTGGPKETKGTDLERTKLYLR